MQAAEWWGQRPHEERRLRRGAPGRPSKTLTAKIAHRWATIDALMSVYYHSCFLSFGGMVSYLVIPIVALVAFPSCKGDSGDGCITTPECRDGLICSESKRRCYLRSQDGDSCKVPHDCDRGLTCSQFDSRCHSPETAACQMKRGCPWEGLCTGKNGKCVAGSNEDCQGSKDCKYWGKCSVNEERCSALSNEDCRNSSPCEKRGKCTAIKGYCRYSTEDCIRSKGCKQVGECTATEDGFECIVGSDDDCRRSVACTEHARCYVKVVPSDQIPHETMTKCGVGSEMDCRKSTVSCKIEGSCGFSSKLQRCFPSSNQDCRDSENCQKLGKCAFRLSPHWYQDRMNYTEFGHCTVGSKKDCAKSDICRNEGKCMRVHHQSMIGESWSCMYPSDNKQSAFSQYYDYQNERPL